MVDIASLAIQIDTSDVARAESDLAKLNGAGTKAEKAAKGVEGAFTGAAKAAGIYRDAAGRLRESNGKLVTESRKVELGLKGVGDQAKRAASEFNSLSNVAGKVGASIVAALSVREVYQATEAYTAISNRLKLVTNSAGEFAAAQAAVFRVAQEGRQPLTETAELYQRIATNQKELGLTGAGVARVTETISKSLAVSGASASTAAGALTQLGQAFASGTLRGEELNSVLEGAPALAQTLARGLNVTVGELRNLGAEGKLTAEQVVGALLSQSAAMDEVFGKLAPNISGAMTTVGNAFTQLIGKMDETSGASSDTAAAIMDVADILADPATVEAAQIMGTGVAKGIGFIAEAATTTVGVVKWMAEELAATFNGIAADDRVRLEDELARLEKMRESGPADRLVFFGRDGVVSYKGDAEIDAEIVKIRQALKAYDGLGAAAGRTGDAAASSAPKIEAFRTGTGRLGAAADDSSKKTDKQAAAFQSLMDGLFPAEAAQRKYNEQVALLDKYLDGDQLAKAVDRLNASLYAGDATGPADAIEDYRKELERLKDDLDPVGVATRKYTKDQDKLNEMLGRGMISAGEHGEMMAELGKRYKENTKETNQWAEWTESALERVDGAFADAWRNIGDGFSSFADSLKNAFRQMLAELAHMAITRPIVMQIGAALGIGGGAGAIASAGGGLGGLANMAGTAYSAITGVGPAALAGFQSGGIGGAVSGIGGYYGGALSGINAGAGQAVGALLNGGGMTYAPLSYQLSSGALNGAIGGLAGIGGALYGYGQSGLKGAATGGLGGWGGAALGNMLLPGLGGIIGGALGSFLGGSVFGGDWQTKDVGLALSAQDGDFVGQSYEYQKKKGGAFRSNKKRTNYSDLDPETLDALQDAYEATEAGVAELFESLSYSIDEGTLDGLQLAKAQISTKGKTEEEIQQAIAEWFGTAADAMTAELNRVFGTGLDLDLAGMQAFVGNLLSVNDAIRYLNLGLFEASVAGGKMAEELSALAGGFDALSQGAATYYSAFFSAAEQQADTLDAVRRTFEKADVTLAESREAYRAMVEDIDITTEAGREMFATLMGLAGQAATYYSIVEQQAAAANAALGAAVDGAAIALRRSIAAQQREIQQAAGKAASNIGALAAVGNSLDAALKRLRGSSDEAIRALRAQAVMTLNSALVTARAGGSLSEFAGLQDALDTASQMDPALYGSLEDFNREQGRTANLIAELEKVNGKQLSVEEKMLKQYERQLEKLDDQLAFAQAQIDALNGVDNSVLSVVEAIRQMNLSVVAALAAMGGDAGKNATPANVGTLAQSVYKTVLGREADAPGLAYWQGQVASGAIRLDQLEQAIRNAARANGEIPAFASGGLHSGGLRLVGEKGPELEVTGPSRIYSASQTAAMLGGGGDAAKEVRALRTDMAGMTDALRSVAKHTMQTAKRVEFLERWDYDGLPTERATA